MKKGDSYHGFKVLDVVYVADCNANGIWLRHERTGLEVFHLLTDDDENLFAFAFRTPPEDSTGAAHVLEHSVLCGSERYPLKDPFIRLVNQSVKTYLNAWTSPDKTVFPASSMVKADYFNLMSVYGDAVFFPLLRPEIFMEEAHHLEIDEKGNPAIQGVVYNEMKGVYSTFESIAGDIAEKTIFAGTPYVHDSGGDPLVIPTLTLAQLKAFHKKYYCPANCLLFLSGNIPTEAQLDFVDKNFLSRFKSGGRRTTIPFTTAVKKVKPFVHEIGPSQEREKGDKKDSNTVMLCWNTSSYGKDGIPSFRRRIEAIFLDELLLGNDGAPVSKALLKSGLGEDIAPQSGAAIEDRENNFCIAMRGVATKNVKKLEQYILKTLADIVKNGIAKDNFESTCLAFEFDTREILRANGPFSLVYLRRCLRGWTFGDKPWTNLYIRSEFETIKKQCEEDPAYLSNMIEDLLLNNKRRSLIVVTPSAEWTKRRTQQEKKLAKKLLAETTVAQVNKCMEKLRAFQQKTESKHDEQCLPHLHRSDLTVKPVKIVTRETEINGVPFFVNEENTNGIVYVDIAFPADVLPPQDYPYLPLLASTVTGMGWGKTKWDEAMLLLGKTMGTFTAYTKTWPVPAGVAKKIYEGRDWFIFYFKMLEEQTGEALSLCADCIANVRFTDTKRLSDIIKETRNDVFSSVVPSGHVYAANRSACKEDRSSAVSEIWEGIASLFTLDHAAKMPAKQLANRFAREFEALKKGGAVIHITAGKKGIAEVKRCLPSFIKATNLTGPAKKRPASDAEFYSLTELPGSKGGDGKQEVFVIPGNVGFAGCMVNSNSYRTKKGVQDAVFAHYLEKTVLWEQIRIVGGAYGVMFSAEGVLPVSEYITYRDPHPFQSLEVLQKCISGTAKIPFTDELVEKTVTGCYSDEIQPKTPGGKGGIGFLRKLYCISPKCNEQRIKWLISIQSKDLKSSETRFSKQKVRNEVVLCGRGLIPAKNGKTTGKIIELPL